MKSPVKTAQSPPKKMTPEEFGQLADKNFREVRVAIGNMIKNGYLTDPDVLGKLLESYANLCNRDYKIAATTPKSQVKCLLMAYHSKLDMLGTPPGCYFVPYQPKEGGRKYLQFQVSYHGLLDLIYDNPNIREVKPEIVLRDDWLEQEMIDGDISINWRPDQQDRLDLKEYKGVIITAYHAVGDKLRPTSAFVPAADIEKVRAKSQTEAKDGRPWFDWEKDMILKSAFKKGTKFFNLYGLRARMAMEWDSWGQAGKGDIVLETGQIVEKDNSVHFTPDQQEQSNATKARVAQAVEGEMIYDADTGERAVKINIDTDQLKELAKQGGDFYKEPTAEKALRELFVGLPTLLAQAQEEAKELLIKSVGTDVPTQLVSDNIKVRVGKRAGVAKFVDGPVMGYAKKVEKLSIDTEKVKEYEAEHGKLPAGIERPEPTISFAVVDLSEQEWI